MNTFLPYPSFTRSAQVLDNKRLGKQRVECLQILKALVDPSYGWQHHPAVEMWRGYGSSLVMYGIFICDAWTDRGFKDTCRAKIGRLAEFFRWDADTKPVWLGKEEFHLSHKSNLLRKDEAHYRKYFGADVPNDLPYVWPVKELK